MKRLLCLFMCICLGLLGNAGIVKAATPRVMVSDYSVDGEEVIAGKDFTLTITLKNTATKAVKNVKLSITTENGELLPAKGAGTAYVEQIDADSEEPITFKMTAANGLEEKAYKLSVKTEYESSGGWEYTVDDTIFIPVSLGQRLSVTDVFLPEAYVELGDTVEVSAVVNNLGEGMLYNVSAKIQGDNLQELENYVGNIESGKSGTVDALTKAIVVTEGNHAKNKIIISYEDKEGNVFEQERVIEVNVAEPVYENLEKVKDKKDNSDLIKGTLKILLIIVVVAGVIWFFDKRRKRKQQMLDDFIN
ncbi:MAG: hypothetical protein K2K56_02625 [Lachnospiraceae bacterium]|nr:hypothetical protein [Lachnospiraceae bacterium]